MIVFFARYPELQLLNDGMYRRIKSIDALFASEKRLYVFPTRLPANDYRIPPLRRINDLVSEQALDFRFIAHAMHFAGLVARARAVYAHTVVHSAQYLQPYLETGKIICDAHGAASEEWELEGHHSCAAFWRPQEKRLVCESARVVVVSHAMAEYYHERYGVARDRFLLLPILPEQVGGEEEGRVEDAQRVGKPVIIYAGGTHRWQNVGLMVDAVQKYPGEAEFIFLSNDLVTFRNHLRDHEIRHPVTVATALPQAMPEWYAKADYGFVLRDDNPVNTVAAPTKLMEYMRFGVVPIIKTDRLGDLRHYRIAHVTLEQFLTGRLPDETRRQEMIRHNREVLVAIGSAYVAGARKLKQLVEEMPFPEAAPVPSTQYPTLLREYVFPLFFACSYEVHGEKHSMTVGVAEYPLEITLEVPDSPVLGMLAIMQDKVPLAIKQAVAVYALRNGATEVRRADLSRLKSTRFGDRLYAGGWIYFPCPDTKVASVRIMLDAVLVGDETGMLAADERLVRIKRLLGVSHRVIRDDGLLVFSRKAWGKGRRAMFIYGRRTVEFLKFRCVQAARTYLPVPAKKALKFFLRKVSAFNTQPYMALGDVRKTDIVMQVDNFLAGGLENVVLDLMAVCRAHGYLVSLVVLGEAGSAVETARQKGFAVYCLTYEKSRYAELFARLGPRLVMAHYSLNGLGQIAGMSIPVLQVIHNSYVWFREDDRNLFAQSATHTTLFIAVSEWVREYSIKKLKLPEEKIHVIENGIDLERFCSPQVRSEGEQLRIDLGFSSDDVIFISVASISIQKNTLNLVRAFHMALSSCPDARLCLVGPVYDQLLKNKVDMYIQTNKLADRVFYLGAIADPAPYYAMSDIFVSYSYYEGGQLSYLESIAMNLPCVSTAIGFLYNKKIYKGLYTVPPPIDFIEYNKTIDTFRTTEDNIKIMSDQISKAYTENARPNFDSEVLDNIDRKRTYEKYLKIIAAIYYNNISNSYHDI